jgi:hypothetical protein
MAISLITWAAQSAQPMLAGLVERITNRSMFLRLLKFIQVDGLSYQYNRREALPGIQFRGINSNYSTPPSVINPQVESLSIFGGEIQTDAILYDLEGDKARQNEIEGKIINAGLFFDRNFIKGDPGTIPLSFPGLNSRLTGNQLLLAGTNGGNMTLEMIDATIDQTVGGDEGKILVMNKATRRNLTTLARNTAKIASMEGVLGKVQTYDDIPIVILDEDGDQQPILAENETCGTAANTVSLYCVKLGGDVDKEMVQGLVGTNMITHRDVGLLGTFYLDVCEMLGSIGVFHPRSATRLAGLLLT